MSVRTLFGSVAMTSGLLLSSLAQAHPELVTSTPAANAEVSSPANIELKFSEKLSTQFSGAKLTMTEMPGMKHPPMNIEAKVSGSNDPKVMVITPAKPLVAGTYKVDWRAVSSDTHPITGSVVFKVK
jgi:methionine-rich copper-binding protein CopC